MSPEQVRVSPMLVNGNKPSAMSPRPEMALRDVSRNININAPSPPALDTIKLCSPFNVELDKSKHGRISQGPCASAGYVERTQIRTWLVQTQYRKVQFSRL
ncbi:hypothetical protein A0H81_01656 [Grifola frondosa]|uniref:Uncharacterized protein n=1 Tax=Grifola frondosa TaxID=5627 RepID=A0A1C7MMA4_GRIFR|nr:hypothetical protein A0H81_01656 [Grifola frondosa]